MEPKRISITYNGNIIPLPENTLLKNSDGFMRFADSFKVIPNRRKTQVIEIGCYKNKVPYFKIQKRVTFEGLKDNRSGDMTIKINKIPYTIGTWREV